MVKPKTRSSARTEPTTSAVQEKSKEPPTSDQGTISDGDSETEVAKPISRKRGRKERQSPESTAEPPVKRVRGKKGKLRGLMNMPIEVFTEISKYLYPLDLILLARSNKFFRRLLMNRSAIQTWQYALSNVSGLPPCPKGLCEPQYAALVFSKHCSMCGNQALRSMDPVLQVRLCASCRDTQLTSVGHREWDLVHKSYKIVPSKNSRQTWWCLSHELATVLAKLDELNRAKDWAAVSNLEKEIMQERSQRVKSAEPLAEFLEKMENEQKDSLAIRKGSRQDEIHTRLLKIGWIEGDFETREKQDTKKWNSLVCVAKPLTERNWEIILPQLIPLLEHTRELRLKEEAITRRQQRRSRLHDWIYSLLQKLPPYVCIADHAVASGEETTETNETNSDPIRCQKQAGSQLDGATIIDTNSGDRVLKPPTPATSLVLSWTSFQLLLETDRPNDQFEAALDEVLPAFVVLLAEWRSKIERALTNRLPPSSHLSHEAPPVCSSESTSTTSSTIPNLDILVDSRPINSFPLDIQRLFRADTFFLDYSLPRFYPDDLQDIFNNEATSWRYDEETSSIAKALLAVLGRPNATYLEMKAAGSSFACGRCCAHNCVKWSDMISHYRDEKQKSNAMQAQESVKNGTVTYVFTHETQSAQSNKPLVKIANEEDKKIPHSSGYSSRFSPCLVCIRLGTYSYFSAVAVIEHVRDVHLVTDPEKGMHYR